jgi:hypothetical protein
LAHIRVCGFPQESRKMFAASTSLDRKSGTA